MNEQNKQNLAFFNKTMDILFRELETVDVMDRVRFENHKRRDNEDVVCVSYEFEKRNSVVHSVYVAVGTRNHVLTLHIDEEDTKNGNEITLTEKMVLLDPDEYRFIIERTNKYIGEVLGRKYPKKDDDILMTVYPKLVEDAILG